MEEYDYIKTRIACIGEDCCNCIFDTRENMYGFYSFCKQGHFRQIKQYTDKSNEIIPLRFCHAFKRKA